MAVTSFASRRINSAQEKPAQIYLSFRASVRRRWWEERHEDLGDLTEPQFAKKYQRKASVVRYARIRIVGRIRRPEGWWQTDKTLAVLRSAMPHRIAAKELGISFMMVRRLRERARLLN
ncbi:MAG: hypothetical protein ACJ8FY_11220 [Gemmataceae bacterium]